MQLSMWTGCGRAGLVEFALVIVTLTCQSAPALARDREPHHQGASEPRRSDRFDPLRARHVAQTMADQVLATDDSAGLPFAVVDKNSALLSVYHADGRLAGSTPVLLGRMPGDQASAGVGERAQSARLRSTDRTTPAGRFAAEPGRNRTGEAIIWLDYNNALALHRLRASPAAEQRAQRLASPWPSDHRITAGCVVVPVAFYDSVVQQVLGHSRSVVYVLGQEGLASLPLRMQVQARTDTPPSP